MLTNSTKHYGIITVFLHWLMAILILFQIGLGIYMVSLPDVDNAQRKVDLILQHKSLGIWILVLVIFRLIWRTLNQIPVLPNPQNRKEYIQNVLAHLVHYILYIYMITLPITGWLLSSAHHYPVYFLGYKLPNLISYNHTYYQFFTFAHQFLAYSLIGFLGLHIGAALLHHFYYKDNILKRMLTISNH